MLLTLPAKLRFLGMLALLMVSGQSAAAEKIRVLYEEGADSIGTYCMGMLELALSRIDHDYEIDIVTGEHTGARIIEEVRSGNLDILWTTGDKDTEKELLPIRIPLYKGLLGHRILIIHPDNQSSFNDIRSLSDMKKVSLGQGTTWADTRILEHNDLDVIRVNKYDSLFHMIDGGRFDGFPRGLQEPWSEITAHPDLDLAVEKRLMLVYRLPFYLYVNQDNTKLAEDLERGFNRAIADGGFDEFFFNDPTVQDALSKADIENRTVINLSNPTLSEQTPVDRAELWLDPSRLTSNLSE